MIPEVATALAIGAVLGITAAAGAWVGFVVVLVAAVLLVVECRAVTARTAPQRSHDAGDLMVTVDVPGCTPATVPAHARGCDLDVEPGDEAMTRREWETRP